MMPTFFRPILAGADLPRRLIGGIGAALCLALTVAVCAGVAIAPADLPAIVAPLGASAVLIFAVPSSPLAQPWPVIGGNTLSALVGVAVTHVVPDVAAAAGLAVGIAIVVMTLLRCLHPPGGAAALTAVIGGPAIHAAGFGFALAPVALNSVVLVLLGMAFHRAATRGYPHRPPSPARLRPAERAAGLLPEDVDAALADMGDAFDITREDLVLLLARARTHALARSASGPGNAPGPASVDLQEPVS